MNPLDQPVWHKNPFSLMHPWMPRLILIGCFSKVSPPYINSSVHFQSKHLTEDGCSHFVFVVSPQDRAYEIVEDTEANKVRKMKKRICLVLDCLCAHDFSDKTADLINLQHYVIKEKRLSEREAIVIFYDVVRVVEALHKVSVESCIKVIPILYCPIKMQQLID